MGVKMRCKECGTTVEWNLAGEWRKGHEANFMRAAQQNGKTAYPCIKCKAEGKSREMEILDEEPRT